MQKLHKPNKSVTNVRMGRTRWRRAAPFYLSEMAESRKMMKYNTEKIRKAVHDELLFQIEGLLNIELGSYLYDINGSNQPRYELWICNTGGIDIYLLDPRYVIFDQEGVEFIDNEECGFSPHHYKYYDTQDWCMVGHYHSDDLIYLILNWKSEVQQMKQEMNRIMEITTDEKETN